MSINDYTPVSVSKRSMSISQILSSQFEPLLLSFLVLAGIIGSSYILGEKLLIESTSLASVQGGNPEKSSIAALLVSSDKENVSKDFNEYLTIDKKITAGEEFKMTFLKDERASRYVMEMGDGMRLIITQKNLYYQYKEPGVYYIELKEIKDGLLNIVGTKKVKVK